MNLWSGINRVIQIYVIFPCLQKYPCTFVQEMELLKNYVGDEKKEYLGDSPIKTKEDGDLISNVENRG